MKTMCEVLEGKQDPTTAENTTANGEQPPLPILQVSQAFLIDLVFPCTIESARRAQLSI